MFASNIQRDTYINDSILVTVLAAVAVIDGSYGTVFEDVIKRRFVRRKRKIMSDIFAELGPLYMQKSYRMQEQHFWMLYNMIKDFSPIEKKRKRNKRGNINGSISMTLRLSIAIRYFAGGAPYYLSN